MLAKDGNGSQDLERRCVSATGHHHIRLGVFVIAGPLPYTDSFSAMHYRLFHGEPLRQCMFACDYHVDVVSAAETVIEDREQAVGIGGQVDAHNIRLLIYNMVEEAGVLVREAVVILLPDVGSEQIVQ